VIDPRSIKRARGPCGAITVRRRLIESESKPLVEPHCRQSGLYICQTRPRWDDTQIGCPYFAFAQCIFSGRGVNYRDRKAVLLKREDDALDCLTAGWRARIGVGTTPAPTQDRPLRQLRSPRRAGHLPSRQLRVRLSAFAATALLGRQNDRVHLRRPFIAKCHVKSGIGYCHGGIAQAIQD
jgi:hypothetical protein